MDQDLQRTNDPADPELDPLGRPQGDEVINGGRRGRSIESGQTDLEDDDIEAGQRGREGGSDTPGI